MLMTYLVRYPPQRREAHTLYKVKNIMYVMYKSFRLLFVLNITQQFSKRTQQTCYLMAITC